MADYFLIAEIIKYFDLDNSLLIYHTSFVYKAQLRTDNNFNSYFLSVFGASDNTGKETLNIKGIIVDIDNFYSLQTSLTDCEDNEESFYFDIANQTLYIHLNHLLNPYACTIEYGKVYGYTNDKVRYFNGITYLPELISVPNYKIRVDPLRYTQQAFYGGDFIFNNRPIDGNNNDGKFDSNEEFTGNEIFCYYGETTDEYDDLLLIANNYIYNTILGMDKVIVKTKDKREQQTKKIPIDTFNDTDFPDIDPDLVGDIKPYAFGYLYAVPGICVNSQQSGNKTFYFASNIVTSPAPVYEAYQDDVWTTITPTASDTGPGLITFANADVHIDGDNTKGLYNVRMTGYFVQPYYYPAQIMELINDVFLNVSFNASNYNLTEWNAEKAYLNEEIGIYLDEEKQIYEWFELLQNGSVLGFQYLFLNGKRTIKIDNPNKTPVMTIYAQQILNNSNPQINNNEDFYSSHAKIFYKKNLITGNFLNYKNTDYYNNVIKEHRKEEQYETETLLNTEAQAIDKSKIIMEDQQKERFTTELLVHGKSFFELELFDIINAELSYPGQKTGVETSGYYETDIKVGYRAFLGMKRLQIIGLDYDFNKGNVLIEVRQRDYSNVFASITGYTP
jgi:hypothetical protein